MTSGDDVAANCAAVERLVRQGARDRADLIVFPENTLHLRIAPGEGSTAPSLSQLEHLSRVVSEVRVPVLLTTAVADGAKFKNSTLLFEPGRPARVVYEKIHLFDVDVPGAPPARESARFNAGVSPVTLEVAGWRFGLSICYDLRFAELYLNYAQKVDAILVPSAFLVPTGRAHWHVLLRARAIEAQCFVVAPAQVGGHVAGPHRRETFGHALVVDPWGEVRIDLTDTPGPTIAVIELDRTRVAAVRAQIPMADHRRPC